MMMFSTKQWVFNATAIAVIVVSLWVVFTNTPPRKPQKYDLILVKLTAIEKKIDAMQAKAHSGAR